MKRKRLLPLFIGSVLIVVLAACATPTATPDKPGQNFCSIAFDHLQREILLLALQAAQ